MKNRPRGRFWVELVLAVVTGFLAILTAVSAEWIELIFGVDPDGGSGALEWGIVVLFAIATVGFALLARTEWRRTGPAPERA